MQRIVTASADIAGIVRMPDDLSMQTHLLAFNAAIESTHAGAYGRRFSVVAKEMGLLSQQSGIPTRQIAELIQHIRQNIDHGFEKMQTPEVLFAQISAVVTQLDKLQNTTTAQSHRVSKIAQKIVEMSNQLQQNEALNTQRVQSAAQLREHSERLAQRVQQFHINAV